MSKLLYPIIVGVLLLFSCKKEGNTQIAISSKSISSLEVNKNELSLNSTTGVWFYHKKPFNGYSLKYYSNALVSERIGFFNGKREGVAKKWFSNGFLKKEYFYVDNTIDGVSKSFWPNGELAKRVVYVGGIKEGVEMSWHQKGKISNKLLGC